MKTFVKILTVALIAVLCVSMLASCGTPASDPDKAVSALKDAGYGAVKDTTLQPAGMKLLGIDGVNAVVTGTKIADGTTNAITIVYFDSTDNAKSAEEKVKSNYSDKDDNKKDDSNWVFKRSGKMVYFGTKDAVKAAK